MPPPRRRAPRLAPAARRRQLLDAALAVAVREGFAELTIDAVAREAGVTRPVVYDQFDGFAGLVSALIDDAEARALAAVGAALPRIEEGMRPDEVLEGAVAAFLSAVGREPGLWRLLLTPREGSPPEVGDRYRRHRDVLIGHVATLLDGWVARIPALKGLDARIMARTMVAVLEDATRLALQHPEAHPAQRLARAAGQIARMVR